MTGNLTLSKTSAQATSTWRGYNVTPSIGYTTPTWDYDSLTITVPAAMAGAVFNSCTLTLNHSAVSGTVYARFSDTKQDVTAARILARLRNGDTTFGIQFSFKAAGGTGGLGDHSSTCRWYGSAYGSPITISVDYLPASAISGNITVSGATVFYSIKQTNVAIGESFNLTLEVKPTAYDLTKVRFYVKEHGQDTSKSWEFDVSTASGGRLLLQRTLTLDALTLTSRVVNADFNVMLTTSAGLKAGTYTASDMKLVSTRRTPAIAIDWHLADNFEYKLFGTLVQGGFDLKPTVIASLDYTADSDIGVETQSITIEGVTYTSGDGSYVIPTAELSGQVAYTVSITDTHGLTSTKTGTLLIAPYYQPKITALAIERYITRTADTGAKEYVADDEGNTVWVTITVDVAPINGKNEWDAMLKVNGGSGTLIQGLHGDDGGTFSWNKSRTLITRTFAPNQEWTLTVNLYDSMGGDVEYTVILPKAGAILSVEKGGVGVGRRNNASKSSPEFQCAYPAVFDSTLVASNHSEQAIPVGRWIDGKTIYRKVVEVAILSVSSSSPTSVSLGISPTRIINIGGFVKTTSYGDLPVNCYHSSAIRAFARPTGLTGNLTAYAGTSCANGGAVFIVDYLKD